MPTDDIHVHAELDTCGLKCPEPVMLLHSKVRDMQVGEVVRIRATDPSTRRDIPQFCQFLGHQLLSQTEQDDVLVFLIEKGKR